MPFHRQTFMRSLGMAISLCCLLTATIAAPASAAVTLTQVATGFDRPVYVTHAGDSRLFVVEQGGRIWVLSGTTKTLFLDVSNKVVCCGEQGLLGLAFHPSYATNRRFYINFTRKSDGATLVMEMRRSATDPTRADPLATYKRKLLVIKQPAANHNGGWMAFKDNLLYIATGDGGGAPGTRAQNKKNLLGKILRINPLDPDGSGPRTYSVPSDNPWVGTAARSEMWARGLRNPWRCSFDRGTGALWCADVGQQKWEEINRSATGKKLNYGWAVMEGRHCYSPSSGCDTTGKTLPIAEYSHDDGCSVTGGYVARRSGASLFGQYLFGDYCSGRLWTIGANHGAGAALPTPTLTGRRISSFGEGNDGRIYLTDLSNGTVYYVNGT
ncbi:PQQ-dependent sugar dehydrogenase [soil metagenome]